MADVYVILMALLHRVICTNYSYGFCICAAARESINFVKKNAA
jgi:hypothetical protein